MTCIDHGRTKSLRPEGYALVGIPGKHSRCTGLHRLVYAAKVHKELDEIKNVVVRHTCDNPRCINPDHLVSGSRADNNRDRAERGRSAKKVPNRQKLTLADVEYIRTHWTKGQPPKPNPTGTCALAKKFGVDTAVIVKVIKGTYTLCHG